MFKKLILTAIMLFMFVFSANAVDTVVGAGAGYLMQKGTSNSFAYYFNMNTPIFSNDSGTAVVQTTVSGLYSDRDFEGTSEITGTRTMVTLSKEVFFKHFSVSLGSGMWYFINTGADDKEQLAYYFGLSYTAFGVDFNLGSDILPLDGNDMYFTSFSIKFLDL